MSAEQVRSYRLHVLEERKLSSSAIHINRAALRLVYARVLKQRWFDEEIVAPKRHIQLPTVLRAEEITDSGYDPESEARDDYGNPVCHRHALP